MSNRPADTVYARLMNSKRSDMAGDGSGPKYTFVYPNLMVNRYSLWMGTMRVSALIILPDCFKSLPPLITSRIPAEGSADP